MKVTKHFLKEILDETVNEFNEKIFNIHNDIEFEFIEKERFMEGVKNDPLIKQQIRLGIYKDIDKEYPNFLVVYNHNKQPILSLLGVPYKISICFEMAKDILKKYNKSEVKAYLQHSLAHEIAHIIEDRIIKNRKDIWNKCLQEACSNEALAKELLAENVADMVSNNRELYEKVMDSIWSVVNNRIKKITKRK